MAFRRQFGVACSYGDYIENTLAAPVSVPANSQRAPVFEKIFDIGCSDVYYCQVVHFDPVQQWVLPEWSLVHESPKECQAKATSNTILSKPCP